MGLLIDGKWHDQWYDTEGNKGEFVRSASQFRQVISTTQYNVEGRVFDAEPDRYHLYVSLACPWAHRTLIMRQLKGLQHLISVDVVDPFMQEHGWTFAQGFPKSQGDSQFGYDYLYQLYAHTDPHYSGRVTVPVLWDKKEGVIVNNESSEIIRIFNTAFDHLGDTPGNYYPEALQASIDSVNAFVYEAINNGVYRAGFATSQAAYNRAVTVLFNGLDQLESRLSRQRYLVGDQLTEADIRLFTTLVRFDPVYVTHFKCDLKRISDYPALSGYLRDIYQIDGIAETVDMAHIRHHYYCSHKTINPAGIIPIGPVFDLNLPHGRASL
jgi:putative glutathione S-transferase